MPVTVENVSLTRIDSTAQYKLGTLHREAGDEFQYVYFHQGDGEVDGVAGQLVYYAASGTTTVPNYTVTMDYDTTTAIDTTIQNAAGFLQAALTNGKYGWIQTKGFNRIAMLTGGGVAAGEVLIPTATNGAVDGVAATAVTTRDIGHALVADSGTAQAIGTAYISM